MIQTKQTRLCKTDCNMAQQHHGREGVQRSSTATLKNTSLSLPQSHPPCPAAYKCCACTQHITPWFPRVVQRIMHPWLKRRPTCTRVAGKCEWDGHAAPHPSLVQVGGGWLVNIYLGVTKCSSRSNMQLLTPDLITPPDLRGDACTHRSNTHKVTKPEAGCCKRQPTPWVLVAVPHCWRHHTAGGLG